ncbi:hypothetical protein C475_03999 [Halosimplex carlsbadense 2-9-1]|uniref:Uncharacterized protein n=1 Tax=Halosimplex carlsbadense 2-9-1 TaxID=797114 RepID=M0D1M5_9EURY|nr:hypothetical protein [Halosimplex carlsbadense]ELZ29350.1 hypothetical protein C475_03999 [Halosimplex carlsbadense 2-9-1]
MSSSGILSRLVTTVSANVLRAVGSLMIVLSVGIAAASVSTDFRLSGANATGATATYTADVGAVTALVEFASAHPAYPAAMLVGLVLVAAGDETPLIGS